MTALGYVWRKARGGHWEQWWVEVCQGAVWHRVGKCSHVTGHRPNPGCMGTPRCEDHGKRRW